MQTPVDAYTLSLNRRELSPQVIVSGEPQVFGRVLSVSEDRRTAHVVWRMTRGAIAAHAPDPLVSDVACVLRGGAEVRLADGSTTRLLPGMTVEFPRRPYELWVDDEFLKVSFIYHPKGLALKPEPL